MVSNCRDGKEALNLAHGSGTLVFELGVEEIAAADSGDVEAYSDLLVSFWSSLYFCISFWRWLQGQVSWVAGSGLCGSRSWFRDWWTQRTREFGCECRISST
jgi:hypothetical protein